MLRILLSLQESWYCSTMMAKERVEHGGQEKWLGPITQESTRGCILNTVGNHRKALSRKVTCLILKILFWLMSKEETGKGGLEAQKAN